MKAIMVEEGTQRLYIGEFTDPKPQKDEVLVQVKATALNRADLLQRRGLYPPPKGASPILGLEMAGVVEEVGEDVTDWKPGDRVCALLPGGGYAQKAVIPAQMAMRIPDNFTFEQAAAIPEVFLTAYLNLILLGGAKAGDYVLIHAGASGVGTAAIQLARELGAKAIVTAGSEKKLQACMSLGAYMAINYKEESFPSKVMEATDGKGVPLILDFIGASYWEQNLSCLAMDGRLMIIGTMGGHKVSEVNLGDILRRRLQIIGTALRSKPVHEKMILTRKFEEFAAERFKDGRLVPVIDTVFPWTEAEQAHLYMEQNQNIGKIILRVE